MKIKFFLGLLFICLTNYLLGMFSKDDLKDFYKQRAREYLSIYCKDLERNYLVDFLQIRMLKIQKIRGGIVNKEELNKQLIDFDIDWKKISYYKELIIKLHCNLLYAEDRKQLALICFFKFSLFNGIHLAHRKCGHDGLYSFETQYLQQSERIPTKDFVRKFDDVAKSLSLAEKQEIILKNEEDFIKAIQDELKISDQ